VTALVEGTGFAFPGLDRPPPPYPAEWLRAKVEAYATEDAPLAATLNKLADSPQAVNALNRTDVNGVNIALDYEIARKLTSPDKEARGRVAKAWGLSPLCV
jgi:hypothetical protein